VCGHCLQENQLRPRQVKRGISDEFLIEDEESSQVDFLVFLVHGIGSICDFKFRNIVEAGRCNFQINLNFVEVY